MLPARACAHLGQVTDSAQFARAYKTGQPLPADIDVPAAVSILARLPVCMGLPPAVCFAAFHRACLQQLMQPQSASGPADRPVSMNVGTVRGCVSACYPARTRTVCFRLEYFLASRSFSSTLVDLRGRRCAPCPVPRPCPYLCCYPSIAEYAEPLCKRTMPTLCLLTAKDVPPPPPPPEAPAYAAPSAPAIRVRVVSSSSPLQRTEAS